MKKILCTVLLTATILFPAWGEEKQPQPQQPVPVSDYSAYRVAPEFPSHCDRRADSTASPQGQPQKPSQSEPKTPKASSLRVVKLDR